MLSIRIEGAPEILGRPREAVSRVEGLFVGPGGFEGWEDGGGDTRQQSTERPNTHGMFDEPVYQGARVITVDGHALAWSPEKLGLLRRRVAAIGAQGNRFKVTVEHQGETLWAMVRRGTKPTFKDAGIRHGMHRASFMIQLVAVDPRLYGELHSFSAGEAAFHRGNFPAAPVFTVQGPHPAYTISAGGKQYVVSSAVPSGATDVIDMMTGWCRRNGTIVRSAVTRADTWTVPPGLPGLVHTFSGDAARFKVQLADTFV